MECSETSAISTQTPGKHPKENITFSTRRKLKIKKPWYCLMFCIGVKFRLQGRTQDEVVTDEGCRESYFDLREEVTGDWRTLHNEYLRDLYTAPNAIM
jgi:hypothetical protein